LKHSAAEKGVARGKKCEMKRDECDMKETVYWGNECKTKRNECEMKGNKCNMKDTLREMNRKKGNERK